MCSSQHIRVDFSMEIIVTKVFYYFISLLVLLLMLVDSYQFPYESVKSAVTDIILLFVVWLSFIWEALKIIEIAKSLSMVFFVFLFPLFYTDTYLCFVKNDAFLFCFTHFAIVTALLFHDIMYLMTSIKVAILAMSRDVFLFVFFGTIALFNVDKSDAMPLFLLGPAILLDELAVVANLERVYKTVPLALTKRLNVYGEVVEQY
ncbi:hypothetical protein EIN_006240 [Entamoeba invadens IP1]|uniref:Uncharacterized protein n=1 Tax=Entamoeba invadens IP1 TaxID=370355 RepID=A0A0A1UCP4_ENTIV|nr:hypothetical protein EIN_006240 [Entamoeba invadens IP1]ELP93683.1 hypothetical protein EIN_006240 [Entamoeba invadens IP1]|eukprot:XP_004260454.1 hypothetical protein EIN_006240 [Entamoeba invadens IP1]